MGRWNAVPRIVSSAACRAAMASLRVRAHDPFHGHRRVRRGALRLGGLEGPPAPFWAIAYILGAAGIYLTDSGFAERFRR